MKEHWWRIIVSNSGFKIAKYLFLIATIFSIIGILSSLNIFKTSQFSDLFLSIGFGLFTLTFGVLSLRIYLESDQLLTSIATGDFYEITYRFWDRAPILYDNQSKGVRDTQSWQLGNLFRHGEKLKKWADSDVQEKLIKEFKTFLERLRPISCTKYWVEVKNYMEISRIAIGFKTENDDMKNELIDELCKWIGEKQEGESKMGYLERKGNEFSQKKKYEAY